MLVRPSEIMRIAEANDIPPEDILFLDFSLSGIDFFPPHARIRFEFMPEDRPYFRTSILRDIKKYFFALPTTSHSVYMIDGGCLLMNGEKIGIVKNIEEDTCDSSYFRRERTVLNLNPVSKSLCHGCKFCHTIKQTARDRDLLTSRAAIQEFIERLLRESNFPDLSHLIQVAIVTGCFGNEQKVIKYLKMVREIFNIYGFNNELLYYGSEITTEKSLDELKEIKPFTLCLSVECFTERNRILRNTKARLTSTAIKNILAKTKDNGFGSRFSYVLGIEPLDVMELNFVSLIPYINHFPVINVFQVHSGQKNLRIANAYKMNYYLKARKIIEGIFMETNMRPRPWENFRGLWYLEFRKEVLDDIRTPY